MRLKTICLFSLFSFLVSCYPTGSVGWYQEQMAITIKEAERNNENILDLKLGMSKEEVFEIMYLPTKTEAYSLSNGKTIEFLFYRTRGKGFLNESDSDSNFTPCAFSNNKLVGWGRNYYDQVVKQAIDININK